MIVTIDLCRFKSCRPMIWKGRYARIPGDTSVFHLRQIKGRMRLIIEWDTEEGVAICAALDCDPVKKLTEAVARTKRLAGGSGSGSFIINEFGQVLVPASDGSGRRYLAGSLEGQLLFENPLDPSKVIDLGDC